jgi:hypothetical protein
MTLELNWGLLDDNDVEQGNLGDALTFWYAFPDSQCSRLHALLTPIP